MESTSDVEVAFDGACGLAALKQRLDAWRATFKRIDLNDALIRHPQATYLMRAAGNAMADAGIGDGDVLLVDRAIHPEPGHVVVAIADGVLVCRRLVYSAGAARLQACGGSEADIIAADSAAPEIWGVVTTVIKTLLG